MIKHEYKEDTLGRKKDAVKYVEFIKNLESNCTIALDSPWGTGKTKLIDYMCDEFDKNNSLYVRYNAWENDYSNEPFLTLINTFFRSLKDKGYTKENVKKIKEYAFYAVKTILPSMLKKGVNKFIDNETMEDLNEYLSGSTESIIDKTFESLDKSHNSREKFTNEFKLTVKNLLIENNTNQLVFIIDELDRCKPTFAIELLENIKHLFEIEGIIFFIAVDKVQLAESIKAVYGQTFDSTTYLHRFFDLKLHLKVDSHHDFFNEKLSRLNCSGVKVSAACSYAVDNLNLSLRDFERILSEAFTLSLLHEHDEKIVTLDKLIIILIMKYKIPKLFNLIESCQEMIFKKIKEEVKKFDINGIILGYLNLCTLILLGQSGDGEDKCCITYIIRQQIKLSKTTLYTN